MPNRRSKRIAEAKTTRLTGSNTGSPTPTGAFHNKDNTQACFMLTASADGENQSGSPSTAAGLPLELSWFLDHCVTIPEDLIEQPLRLAVQRNVTALPDSPTNTKDEYEISEVLYESIRNFVSTSPEGQIGGWMSGPDNARFRFTGDFLRLMFPNSQPGSHAFLTAVIEHFAKDIGADIVRLSFEDIETVANQIYHRMINHEENCDPDGDSALDYFFGCDSNTCDRPQFPFGPLLSSPSTKRALRYSRHEEENTSETMTRPLIIHIPTVLEFSKTHLHSKISKEICAAGKHLDLDGGRIIVIGADAADLCSCVHCSTSDLTPSNEPRSTCKSCPFTCSVRPLRHVDEPDSFPCHACLVNHPLQFGEISPTWAILVAPMHCESQIRLLERDERLYHEKANISSIKKMMRLRYSTQTTPKPLLPYFAWDITNNQALDILRGGVLDKRKCEMIARAVGDEFEILHIERCIIELGALSQMLETWSTVSEMREWVNAPKHVQKAIHSIQNDDTTYRTERTLLDCIIKPDTLTETWKDICLEPNAKAVLDRLIKTNLTDSKASKAPHGLLKNNRLGGLLLYGPPGTGKTQLARILAKESKMSVIHVSAADIESKYVGETEKIIQALFKLGRMLFPSIIFIDEADSLLASRSDQDKSWERNRINQFLRETDGFTREVTQPFLILATNNPGFLDHAVLRRVPSKLYLGLPPQAARHDILSILLQDEQTDPDVDLEAMAGRTRRYTGSDLRSLCIQAALICEDELHASTCEPATESKRVLTNVHFNKALDGINPSVPEDAFGALKRFARDFDPPGEKSIRRDAFVPSEFKPPLLDPVSASSPGRKRGISDLISEDRGVFRSKKTQIASATTIQMADELIKELPYTRANSP